MEKTIFEKIIEGSLPSYKVYEDEYTYAFLDIHPVTEGHTLLIPKTAFANIFEIDDETLQKVAISLKKVATLLQEKLSCGGINIIQNNGQSAGQIVTDHIHFHIIPRYGTDNYEHWKGSETLVEDLENTLKKIQK